MSSRNIILLIVVLVAGFMLVSIRNFFTESQVQEAQQTAPRILVAKRNIASGSFIDIAQDLDLQPAPATAAGGAASDYQYENAVNVQAFAGAVARKNIAVGEPITPASVMKTGEGGFLAAVLKPGMRAVSISVNPISGNAGFVSPSDMVDLLITYQTKSAGHNSIGTETFIRNVRVLAVDQALNNPENKAMLAKTITVEVTPADAEKISVAAEMGKISVALVSAGMPTEQPAAAKDETNYTVGGDVSRLLSQQEKSTASVKVIRADKVETLEFYQEKQ